MLHEFAAGYGWYDDVMLTQSTFYSRVFALVVAALLGYALFRIFAPFFTAMSWAMFLAFLLYPVNLRLRRRLRGSARAAGLLTVLTPLVVLLPLSALSVDFVAQVSSLLRLLQQRARATRHQELLGFAAVPADCARQHLAAGACGHFGRSSSGLGDFRLAGHPAARRRVVRILFPGRFGIAGRILDHAVSSVLFPARRRGHGDAGARRSSRSRKSAKNACFGRFPEWPAPSCSAPS